MRASARFEITGWTPESSDNPDAGPALSRIRISKAFTDGDLTGTSEGEGLFCGMGAPENGAGYVVSERFSGELKGRSGSLVLHHGGLMGPGIEPHTFGDIVPGSGTGELEGIAGTMEIMRTDEGEHTLVLDYTL